MMNEDVNNGMIVSIRRHLRAGAAVTLMLIGGVGTWAFATNIAGAVIAQGKVVVDTNVKKVQHPAGGVVSELLVREGDHVAEGEVLVRLDATLTLANLAIVSKGLNELVARKARLEAERDGTDEVTIPSELTRNADNSDIARIIDGEMRLFTIRRQARVGEKEQLRQRIAQLREELVGYAAQEQAKAREISLIGRELEGVRTLWDRQLMSMTKLTALEREEARLKGEHGLLVATQAQVKGKISETELQITQVDRNLASEVARELREVDAKIGELVERKVAAEDQIKRIEMRAPQNGQVHQLAVHTIGAVIAPGELVMSIVPVTDMLKIEANVAPQDVDQLLIGQQAVLRFSAFNHQTTPEINGTLDRVSPDTITDQRTGQPYYTVRISVDAAEITRLGAVKLVPGMPVEVFAQTGARTAISYLVKPLRDQLARAFRG